MSTEMACPACKTPIVVTELHRTEVEKGKVDFSSTLPASSMRKGDQTVCTNCLAHLVVSPDLQWVEVTPEQWLEMSLDDQKFIKKVQDLLKKRGEKKPKNSRKAQEKAASAVIAMMNLKRSLEENKVFEANDPVRVISLAALAGLIEKAKYRDDDKTFVLGAGYAITCAIFSEGDVEEFKLHLDEDSKKLENEMAKTGARVRETEDAYEIIYKEV